MTHNGLINVLVASIYSECCEKLSKMRANEKEEKMLLGRGRVINRTITNTEFSLMSQVEKTSKRFYMLHESLI